MSKNWVKDIKSMHDKYKVNEWVKNNPEKLKEYLEFRLKFVQEELTETFNACENNDAEELVDGLIDIIVVALGTLDAFDVDAYKAWNRVLKANMKKEVGMKPERPNTLGLPDLIKPKGWKAPSHKGNHGLF